MLKKIAMIVLLCVLVLNVSACTQKKPAAPVADNANTLQKEQIIKDAKALVSQNEEPEKMVALIQANIQFAGKDGAEIMISGLEQLQESHLSEYTDLLLEEGNQKILMETVQDLNNPSTYESMGNTDLAALLGKLKKSGYRFENFEGSWYPILDYSSYRQYLSYLSEELKEYIALMATESDKVTMKDAAIVIDLEDLAKRLILAETYIVKNGGSPRIDRVKETYAGYLWNFIGGANNTPIYDYETKAIKPEVRDAYEKFSRENPDLVSTKAVRNWLTILREGKFTFDENTMYQSLDSIYADTLKDLGIEADYK